MTQDKSLTAKLVAEFVGTFALIFVGILVLTNMDAPAPTDVALAHGLTIAVMVSATMMISGGHLNPAVTAGAWVAGKIRGTDALGYVFAQLSGGLAGGLLARTILGARYGDGLAGTPHLQGIDPATGLLVEAILTFFLVFVVFGTGIDARFGGRIGGLAIGLTVTLDILAGGPLTGGAMNPARWFGAAMPARQTAEVLVYTVGPLLGGVAAGLLWSKVLAPGKGNA